MDYTTLALCKEPGHIYTVKDDSFLTYLVAQVSRDIDRYCTGSSDISSDDYFMLEDVVDEIVPGNIDRRQRLLFYPRKSVVNSVASAAYRITPMDAWTNVEGCFANGIEAWVWLAGVSYSRHEPSMLPTKCQVKVTYNGGFANSPAGLPGDLVQAATQLVIRAYHEYESGLNDAVGNDETGIYIYNKAMPLTIRRKLELYMRPVGWRHF